MRLGPTCSTVAIPGLRRLDRGPALFRLLLGAEEGVGVDPHSASGSTVALDLPVGDPVVDGASRDARDAAGFRDRDGAPAESRHVCQRFTMRTMGRELNTAVVSHRRATVVLGVWLGADCLSEWNRICRNATPLPGGVGDCRSDAPQEAERTSSARGAWARSIGPPTRS